MAWPGTLLLQPGCHFPNRVFCLSFLLFFFSFSFLFFFDVDHLKKVFIEFVTILLLFYVLIFGQEACGILAPRPGIVPTAPGLEGKVFTAREVP